MLNRRLIRIKAFKVLFAAVGSDESVSRATKELLLSCEKTKELYYFLLNISGALVNTAQDKIDAGLRKFRPSQQESNPNMKFVNNRFTAIVDADPEFGKYCQKNGLTWSEYDVFVKKVFNSIVASDYYQEYMNSSENSLEEDCALFTHIFEQEFEDNDSLDAILEDMSAYWIDDVAYVLNVIIANIAVTARKQKIVHPSTFLKEEDKEFAVELLEESIGRFESYKQLISDNVSNWETDRLVATDIALMVMGITEAVCFPNIPIKVTINEYVEIAKYYSTPNSRVFVNGLLDKIIQKKVEAKEIVKSGRGLADGTAETDK